MSEGRPEKKKILIVPLNWGLGHATRLIPVIHEFKNQGAEVLISGGPEQIRILHEEFSELNEVRLPRLRIRLSRGRAQVLYLFLQIPGIIIYLFREYFALKRLLRTEKPDVVISDNCYALRNRKVPSIIISHQLQIQLPRSIKFLQGFVNAVNHHLVRKFDACWIPDLPGSKNLAGKLSHQLPSDLDHRYVGVLSRFSALVNNATPPVQRSGNILILISGPENQRSHFENLIYRELQSLPETLSYKVIRGLPASDSDKNETGWYPHAGTKDLYRYIMEADTIICRSGYSTIMDLAVLGKNAWLIPTPGQSEQEYLACHLTEKNLFHSILQRQFKLKDVLNSQASFKTETLKDIGKESSGLLKGAVADLLESLK